MHVKNNCAGVLHKKYPLPSHEQPGGILTPAHQSIKQDRRRDIEMREWVSETNEAITRGGLLSVRIKKLFKFIPGLPPSRDGT